LKTTTTKEKGHHFSYNVCLQIFPRIVTCSM